VIGWAGCSPGSSPGWLTGWNSWRGGSLLVALGAAALAGVALGLSPVTYLFMPAVVGYAGAGGEDTSRRRAAKLSLAFVLGVTTLYVALGVLWGSIGLLLLGARRSLWLWYGLGAIALLLMGLNLAGLVRLGLPLLKTPSRGTG
jgi:cytochrome c biogenesis protein CcdA